MRTAVVTIAAGRRAHLARQTRDLRRTPGVDHRVIVAMGAGEGAAGRAVAPDADVLEVAATGDRLPLAGARNRGAQRALDAGAELLVFLDVDCLPAPGAVAAYRDAAAALPDALLCGPVAYLPPPPPAGYPDPSMLGSLASPHPGRPAPAEGHVDVPGDHRLFWSLAFAVTAATWRRVGGFHEAYTGYGAEDTDYAQVARAAGVPLAWVGGARAYHQHHPTSSPPVQHLDAIVRNAELFRRRWGWWPMRGWLDAFAARGLLAEVDDAADRLTRRGPQLPPGSGDAAP